MQAIRPLVCDKLKRRRGADEGPEISGLPCLLLRNSQVCCACMSWSLFWWICGLLCLHELVVVVVHLRFVALT